MGNGLEATEFEYGIPEYHHPNLPGWARKLPLPMGLAAADLIIPVSPGYAEEIQTAEFGCGLEGLLSHRREHIVGIINGIDTSLWDPSSDPSIPAPFTIDALDFKEKNKRVLQANLISTYRAEDSLLMAVISRLDYQKGIDLIVDGLYKLDLTYQWQCILLGTGDPYLEMKIRKSTKG